MKAIILAAGFGNRMSPLTNSKHKTLLQVNGEAIMDRILNSLLQNNVLNVVIVTGYKADELMLHVKSKYVNLNFEFVHNERYRETNNIYSLALAFQNITFDDDILLIESDLIYSNDVIKQAISSPHHNVALVSPYQTGLDGTVVQISDHKITSVFPPHLQDEKFNLFDKYKTLNIYKFSKEFCANEFKKLLVYYAKSIDDNCYYELILGILIYMQRQEIFCEIIDNSKWVEVDDPNDLSCAEFSFNSKNRIKILEDSFGGYWNYDVLDFCFIRNMHFPTQSMIAEMRNNLSSLLTNYGSKQSILNLKLSYVLQCNADNLIALNGASQIYPILSKMLVGKNILLPNPTFGEYQRIFCATEKYGDFDGIDPIEVEEKLSNQDVLVIVNPNNPSGSLVSTNWILTLVDKYPNKFFIIDESFIEFSNETSIIDFLENKARNNVLVIRSMSKSYGLPGIRLGFIYTCDRSLINYISNIIPIWNMNSMAEYFLEIILKNKRSLAQSFQDTIKDREAFTQNLKTLGIFDKVYPSGADFILVRTKNNSEVNMGLVKHLLINQKIFIKDVSDKYYEKNHRFYRLAVRLPDENNRLVESIRGFEQEYF